MLAVYVLLLLIWNGNCKILIESDNNDILTCITEIIKKYYEGRKLTFVDINSKDNDVLKAVTSMMFVSVISRKPTTGLAVPNEGYLILSGDTTDFIGNFSYLIREVYWNPSSKFLIIIKSLQQNNLEDIFKELLDVHVTNALVINGTDTGDIYTYNPFEDYACGRYFNRIIPYGQCSDPIVENLFPDKLVTGLRNCTFTAAVTHFPPYTIDPHRADNIAIEGTEQFAFGVMSELEQFKINYVYNDFSEEVSTVDSNMTAVGVLSLIQSKQVDALFGFMVLTRARASAFGYLYAHLTFTDEFTYVVPKAGAVPVWKNIYLEFNSTVWILLGTSFVLCGILISVFIQVSDKTLVVLKMWDMLLLHGHVIRCRITVKFIFIIWIWFSYLVNSFYQSSLVSLTTHPIEAHQVSNEEELMAYKFKSCVSSAISEFMFSVADQTFGDVEKDCEQIIQSVQTISKSEEMYTIIPLSIYEYNRYMFYDKRGKIRIYHFDRAINKIIYAIYLYKGFPMQNRMHVHTVRLRENGLMDKHFNDLYYAHKRKYEDDVEYDMTFVAQLLVPWNILGIGSLLATIVFIIEINCKKNIHKTEFKEPFPLAPEFVTTDSKHHEENIRAKR